MVIQAEEDARRQWHSSEGLSEKPTTSSWSRRSKPQSRLHNFSFPTLSWGNQKFLRCSNSSGRSTDEELQKSMRCSSSSSPNEPPLPPPPPRRFPVQKQGAEEDEEAKESNPSGASASRPWNLRSRRAPKNAPSEIVLNRNPSPSSPFPSPSHSSLHKEKISSPMIFLTRLEGLEMRENGARRKFSIALSREEIEEDFLVAKGAKPPRRPKKRAKYVQRQLDALFPGILLAEVTTDLYKTGERDRFF
ncbi:hypothetical protein KSP39_PZI005656 [Platanthera zijinensis]|uniref:Uncharacterized protein n=1 Tax=Platanthera zijinensis TaxID=2320716 RepID=A0AAP0GAJ8_9ASPA